MSLDVIRRCAGASRSSASASGISRIGQAFGGIVVRAPGHAREDRLIHHDGRGVFAGLPIPFEATRYHSLVVVGRLPECLEVTAETDDGLIMGLRHRSSRSRACSSTRSRS